MAIPHQLVHIGRKNTMARFLLSIHIMAGFTALASGLGAMALSKASKVHRPIGQIYFVSMLIIFCTAVPLSWVDQNWFLFTISFFSFYLALSGFRIARTKGNRTTPTDCLISVAMVGISSWMVGLSVHNLLIGKTATALVIGIFGLLSLLDSVRDLRYAWSVSTPSQHWVRMHLGRMGGSYIAAVTAFAVNVIDFWPPVYNWLGPTLIGTIALTFLSRYYQRKWNLQSKEN
jgi:hypothetical protein